MFSLQMQNNGGVQHIYKKPFKIIDILDILYLDCI